MKTPEKHFEDYHGDMTASIENEHRKNERTAERARGFWYAGGKTGVLLLHGFAGSIDDLRPLAEALHADGYSVMGARLAGHGATEDDLNASTAEDWLASARLALHSLASRVDKVVVAGESMGGLVALRLARECPAVKGAVLLAPPFRLRQEGLRRLASRMLPGMVRWKKPWINTPARAAEYRAKGSLIKVSIFGLRELLRLIDAERNALSQNRVPLLVILARGDYSTHPESADRLRFGLPPERCTFLMVEDAVHHLMASQRRDDIILAVRDFIHKNT